MKFIKFPYLIILVFCAIGCKHQTNYNDYPEVSYASNVSPIIIGNCTQSGCHGSNDGRSFELLTYEDVIKRGGINTSNPDKSKLLKVIKSLNNNSRMPRPPFDPLTNDQIKTIYLWIGQGAKNN